MMNKITVTLIPLLFCALCGCSAAALENADDSAGTAITFSDDGVEISGAGASADGTTAIITEAGSYLLSGSCADGMIIVYTNGEVALTLGGLDLCKNTSAAIYVRAAKSVAVTLAEASENTLASTGTYVPIDDNNIDGVIFSKDDLSFDGSGSLQITSESAHGIVGKDNLTISSGSYTITAAKHSISANDSLTIAGGSFTLTADKDTLHSNGELTVMGGELTLLSGDDALHADKDLTIENGVLFIGQSNEGIEGKTVSICGGDITLCAADDGINAADSLTISGGTVNVTASGDGLDSNGSLTVSGGMICINGPTGNGDGMIDYETNAAITGGTLLAAGSMGMAVNFGDGSTQCSILLATGSQSAGTPVVLTDAAGAEIVSWTPATDYAGVLISSAGLTVGEACTITAGDFSETIVPEDFIYGRGMDEHRGMRR